MFSAPKKFERVATIASREPSLLNHIDSEHPSRLGENDLSAARYLSAASSVRGAFKINLAETKRDRSINIGVASSSARSARVVEER